MSIVKWKVNDLILISGLRWGCVISPTQFNLYRDEMMNEFKIEMVVRMMENGKEWG